MADFEFDKPAEGDRAERQSSMPPFKVLNYKSGKTGELHAKATTPEQVKQFFVNGDVGFSFYDKEIGSTNVQEGTFALLGMYWKLNTYTGGKNDVDRYTSNMVLDIKKDEMQVYRNGEPTKYKGTYRELKEQNIWTKETRISLYWVVMELVSDRLFAMELSNTVKNGIKRAVLKAYSKPITAQSIEREGLFGLFDSPDNFHCFILRGANMANAKGMPYKGEKGEGDGYCMPHFECVILRREKSPNVAQALSETRKAFFTALAEKQRQGAPAARQEEEDVEIVESLKDIDWKQPLPGANVAQAMMSAKSDPFESGDDLPF
jgi:hypothetical protein